MVVKQELEERRAAKVELDTILEDLGEQPRMNVSVLDNYRALVEEAVLQRVAGRAIARVINHKLSVSGLKRPDGKPLTITVRSVNRYIQALKARGDVRPAHAVHHGQGGVLPTEVALSSIAVHVDESATPAAIEARPASTAERPNYASRAAATRTTLAGRRVREEEEMQDTDPFFLRTGSSLER